MEIILVTQSATCVTSVDEHATSSSACYVPALADANVWDQDVLHVKTIVWRRMRGLKNI